MNGQDLLRGAVDVLRASFSGIAPESAVCFLYLMAHDGMTVGKIAGALSLSEPIAYRHLSALQQLGLIAFVNTGTGANQVKLTDAGHALCAEINTALG